MDSTPPRSTAWDDVGRSVPRGACGHRPESTRWDGLATRRSPTCSPTRVVTYQVNAEVDRYIALPAGASYLIANRKSWAPPNARQQLAPIRFRAFPRQVARPGSLRRSPICGIRRAVGATVRSPRDRALMASWLARSTDRFQLRRRRCNRTYLPVDALASCRPVVEIVYLSFSSSYARFVLGRSLVQRKRITTNKN